MRLFILLISLIIGLISCHENNLESELKGLNLKEINTINWDKPSKDYIFSLTEISIQNYTLDQFILLSEILISHKLYKQALIILTHLKQEGDQYIEFLTAFAFFESGAVESALNSIDINRKNNNQAILHLIYQSYLEQGKPLKVRDLFSGSIDPLSTDYLSNYYLTLAYLQLNQCNKAIDLLKKLIKSHSYATKLYKPLTIAYQQCGQHKQAAASRIKIGTIPLTNNTDYNVQLFKHGNPVSYVKQQLRSALVNNNAASIIELTEQLIEYGSYTSKMLNNYAIVLYKSNRIKKANIALHLSLEINNSNLKTLEYLYEFNKTINYKIAESALSKLIRIDPHNSTYTNAQLFLKTHWYK